MNRFTVVSSPDADLQLAAIWNKASDRKAVTEAQHHIDMLLGSDPSQFGRLVAEDLWVIESYPLRVYFEVSEPDRMVKILEIHSVS